MSKKSLFTITVRYKWGTKLQNIIYVVQFIFSLFYRLVTSDVAFYSGTYKTLRGLEHLSNHMSDLWNGL